MSGLQGAQQYLEQLQDALAPRSLKSHVATPFGTSFFGVPSLALFDLLETKYSCESPAPETKLRKEAIFDSRVLGLVQVALPPGLMDHLTG